MIDRRLVILIILLALYVLYVRPRAEEAKASADHVSLLRSQIAKEEAIAVALEEFPEKFAALAEGARENRRFLFAPDVNESKALGRLQELVQAAASASGVEVNRSNWGEPIAVAERGIVRLPLSFSIQGLPPQVDEFLRSLFAADFLIEAETAQVKNVVGKHLVLEMAIVGFKAVAAPALTEEGAGGRPSAADAERPAGDER
jgi:Tfp pilus assembly protein PilO